MQVYSKKYLKLAKPKNQVRKTEAQYSVSLYNQRTLTEDSKMNIHMHMIRLNTLFPVTHPHPVLSPALVISIVIGIYK